jgi:hypothetical protein
MRNGINMKNEKQVVNKGYTPVCKSKLYQEDADVKGIYIQLKEENVEY